MLLISYISGVGLRWVPIRQIGVLLCQRGNGISLLVVDQNLAQADRRVRLKSRVSLALAVIRQIGVLVRMQAQVTPGQVMVHRVRLRQIRVPLALAVTRQIGVLLIIINGPGMSIGITRRSGVFGIKDAAGSRDAGNSKQLG